MKKNVCRALGTLAALSCAALAVWQLNKLARAVERLAEAQSAERPAPPPAAERPRPQAPAKAPALPAQGEAATCERGAGEVVLHGVDDATAAMLMAIVLHNTGARAGDLRFVSIREA